MLSSEDVRKELAAVSYKDQTVHPDARAFKGFYSIQY